MSPAPHSPPRKQCYQAFRCYKYPTQVLEQMLDLILYPEYPLHQLLTFNYLCTSSPPCTTCSLLFQHPRLPSSDMSSRQGALDGDRLCRKSMGMRAGTRATHSSPLIYFMNQDWVLFANVCLRNLCCQWGRCSDVSCWTLSTGSWCPWPAPSLQFNFPTSLLRRQEKTCFWLFVASRHKGLQSTRSFKAFLQESSDKSNSGVKLIHLHLWSNKPQ